MTSLNLIIFKHLSYIVTNMSYYKTSIIDTVKTRSDFNVISYNTNNRFSA